MAHLGAVLLKELAFLYDDPLDCLRQRLHLDPSLGSTLSQMEGAVFFLSCVPYLRPCVQRHMGLSVRNHLADIQEGSSISSQGG